jgi:general L-amino acid transport system substrate-binding protein
MLKQAHLIGAFWCAAVALSSAPASADSPTLKSVKDRGSLTCGVSQGLAGFSIADDKGTWSGLDVDFCRGLAAAVLNDSNKVTFVPLSPAERFDALRDSKIDVLARNSTWTISREVEDGITFVGVNYYDGQGFLIHKDANVSSALELDGAKICVQNGTTNAANVEDYFKANNLKYELVTSSSPADALKDYSEGHCAVLTSDISQLYAQRLQLPKPADHTILPDVISKEPLGPAVRSADPAWANIVKWVLFASLDAEELGVGAETIDQAMKSKKPDIMRLVGSDGRFGEKMGLSNDWAANAIKAVGNYGESYERNVGSKSKLGIPRGLNQLWSLGGIQYAPPLR